MAYVDTRDRRGVGFEGMAGRPHADRPAGELAKELLDQGQHLFRKEIELAKLEAREEAILAAKAGAGAAAGGVVLHTAMLVFVATAVLLLGTVMPMWLSALIVGVLLAIAGGVALMTAKKKADQVDKPKDTQTAETLQEDKVWARRTMQDMKSNVRARA